MIHLANIVKKYKLGEIETTVLSNISLTIAQGEMIAIMGASGSGKSTLLNIIGLLDRPTQGNYYLFNNDVESLNDDELAMLRNHTFGFVFQQFFLLPRLTALDNVLLPLKYRGNKIENPLEKALNLLEKMKIKDRAHHKPNELSGGQQQRVAIARALINDPAVILADEPTGALDSHTGTDIMNIFGQLNREENRTIVIITHDQDIAKQCKRSVHISDGVIS